MKLTYFKTRIVYTLFVFVMLLQSCSIYQKKSTTLDEASKSNSKVRIEMVYQKKLDVKKVEYKEGSYYGLKDVYNKTVSIPLDEKDIKSLRVLDKSKSDLGTMGLIIGFILVGAVFYLGATFTVF